MASANMMVKLRNGETNEVSTKILMPFLSKYENVDANYILTGRGTPLRENIEATQIYQPKYTEKTDPEGTITLYDVEAAANLKTLFDNKDQNILGQINIPNIPKCDGSVYVKGDSMYPLLKSWDIVAYKEIPLEMNHIFFGEMYLVSIDLDGDEYLTVKYVQHCYFLIFITKYPATAITRITASAIAYPPASILNCCHLVSSASTG